MINAVIYARTSYDCTMAAESQIDRLKAIAGDHGWNVCKIFVDRPMPTKKGRERRPAFDPLRSDARFKDLMHRIGLSAES